MDRIRPMKASHRTDSSSARTTGAPNILGDVGILPNMNTVVTIPVKTPRVTLHNVFIFPPCIQDLLWTPWESLNLTLPDSVLLLFLYVDDYSGSIVSLNAERFCAAI